MDDLKKAFEALGLGAPSPKILAMQAASDEVEAMMRKKLGPSGEIQVGYADGTSETVRVFPREEAK